MEYLILTVCALYLTWLLLAEVLSVRFPKIFGPTYRFFNTIGLTFAGKVFGPNPRKLMSSFRYRVKLKDNSQIILDPDPAKTPTIFRNRVWVFHHNLARLNSSRHYLAYCRYLLEAEGIDITKVTAIRLDIRNVIATEEKFETHDFFWDLLGEETFEQTTSFA